MLKAYLLYTLEFRKSKKLALLAAECYFFLAFAYLLSYTYMLESILDF